MGIYNEEHQIFRDSVRKFCSAQITPRVKDWEDAKHFPDEVFEQLGAQGFLGVLLDERWGGAGADYLMAGAWCEEFGRVPAVGLTIAVNMHSLVIAPTLQRFGTETAKAQFLPGSAAGTMIGAYAFTEPGAGSDLTSIQTKAVEADGGYVLNGSKIFITNGARADYVLVLARTSAGTGYDGFTTFLVDTTWSGFRVERTLSKLGWHSSDTAELTFTDVRVPKEYVLGQPGRGWYQAMESLQWERLMLTLNALGGAMACLESTATYVADRRVFGKPVASFDNTREVLTRLWAKHRSALALTHHALDLLHRGERCRKESSLAKLYGCELAIEIADRCLQLHGGYGYTTEFLPERWLRDLRLNTIGGGTSEIMARIAAGEMLAGS
ncbi:MAG: acyl-CoA/acyl-ACP dehydrogenase [Deltaproteobacteria bacterium]|nr:acyl-CoA/acyl-ACP dehydrogenase [Deltaproteobacteria bacterium]